MNKITEIFTDPLIEYSVNGMIRKYNKIKLWKEE